MRYFYVICPVGTDPRFQEKKSALEELGRKYEIEPSFPLDRSCRLTATIIARQMRLAEFVLADLSLERPSCYFELGIAQAVDAAVALIAAAGTPIHQTGDLKEIVFYSDLAQYRLEVSRILASRTATRLPPR